MGIWSPSTPGPSPAFAGTRSVRAFALWKVGFLGSLFRVQGTGFKGLLLYSLRFYVLKAGAFGLRLPSVLRQSTLLLPLAATLSAPCIHAFLC